MSKYSTESSESHQRENDKMRHREKIPDLEWLFQDEKLAFLCRLAVEEYKNPSLYSQELLESLFQQILLLILRNFQSKQAKSDSSTLSKKALYTQLRNYINTHIYSLKNLNDLSDIFNYNYSYLSALFKELNGDTILAYYQKKRLNAAQLLIMERKLKINEISELLNYSSPSSFSRAFKEMYNISPKQYAKKLWDW
jgi:AraC-like DNA-binding protein